MKKLMFILSFLLPVAAFSNLPGGEWVAPKTADTISNPMAGDAASVKNGKVLFGQLCAICHGDKGKGNGIAGVSLNPKPTDLRKARVQTQTDGAIFWKITTGRVPMASYETTLSVDQRWQLVNFIRTFNNN